MSDYITKIRTADGDKQIDYKGLANLPTPTVVKGTLFPFGLPDGVPATVSSLESCTWEQISAISNAGLGDLYFDIGDTKSVVLNGTVGTLVLNTTLYSYIIGFDHNAAVEGKGIAFGTWKTADGTSVVLVDEYYGTTTYDNGKRFNMNHSNENGDSATYGGWKGCDMRYDILGSTNVAPSGYGSLPVEGRIGYNPQNYDIVNNPVENTLMAALPVALRAVMKPITKYTDNVGGGAGSVEGNVTSSVDYLPLLGAYEVTADVTGHTNTYEADHQQPYEYYAGSGDTTANRTRYKHSDTSTAAHWCLRSPSASNATAFRSVNLGGVSTNSVSTSRASRGLAPAFLV